MIFRENAIMITSGENIHIYLTLSDWMIHPILIIGVLDTAVIIPAIHVIL